MDENRQTPGAVTRKNGMDSRGEMFVDVGVVNVGSLEASSENRMAARGKTCAQQMQSMCYCGVRVVLVLVLVLILVLILVLVLLFLPLVSPPQGPAVWPVGVVASAVCQ